MTAPRNSSSRRAGLVALVAALASLVSLFFLTCEKREIEVPRDYHGEAARNPYLAAQRLLERMGTPVRAFPDLASMPGLPPERALLIVPTPRRTLTPARAEALLGWVARGGHLLVVTWQLFDDPERMPDLVLDPLGVRQYMNEPEADAPEDDGEDDGEEAPEPAEPEVEPGVTQASAVDVEAEEPEPELALGDFPDRETRLRVEFDPEFRLELDPRAKDDWVFEIGDANGVHLLILRHGEGLVTALTDDYFLTHPTIEDWDHAELVYRLAHFDGEARPVWLVYGDSYPGALALIWRNGWMVLTSAGIALALWCWSVSRRFGPLAPDPTTARRSLMEHVRAAGQFQWRRGASKALVDATREALLARVRERHPSFAGLSPAEQAERLAQLSGLPRERVALALAFRSDTEAGRFAQDVAVLEKIRRSL